MGRWRSSVTAGLLLMSWLLLPATGVGQQVAAKPAAAAVTCVPPVRRNPACSPCPAPCPVCCPAPAPAAGDETALKVLDQVAQVSTLAIDASRDKVSLIQDFYQTLITAAVGGVSLLVSVLAFFGWKTFNAVLAPYRKSAQRMTEEHRRDLDKIKQDFETHVRELKARLEQQALAQTAALGEQEARQREERHQERDKIQALTFDNITASERMSRADVLWRSARPGSGQLPPAASKAVLEEARELYRQVIPLLQRIAASGEATLRNRVWALSCKAQSQSRGGDPAAAVDTEREALRLSLDALAQDPEAIPRSRIPEKRYNLACYLCLTGRLAEGAAELASAHGESAGALDGAEQDPDLKALLDDPGEPGRRYRALLANRAG